MNDIHDTTDNDDVRNHKKEHYIQLEYMYTTLRNYNYYSRSDCVLLRERYMCSGDGQWRLRNDFTEISLCIDIVKHSCDEMYF